MKIDPHQERVGNLPEEESLSMPDQESSSIGKPSVLFNLLGGTIAMIVIAVLITAAADRFRDLLLVLLPVKPVPAVMMTEKQYAKEFQTQKRLIDSQKKKLKSFTPTQNYLIINSSENKITLMKGNKVVHEGLCSTGSYTVLKTADGKEKWIFQTPRGMLRVQNKLVDPVWRMPDWAFIEEGLPVPPPFAAERYEYNVLGDYALDLGRGYLIHGTLYKRFLGMPVTHGCVRLGDEELKIVYDSLSIGSKVFIY